MTAVPAKSARVLARFGLASQHARVGKLLASPLLLSVLFAFAPAAAQSLDGGASGAFPPNCVAFARPVDEGVSILRVACGETGLVLGPADEYRLIPVPPLGVALVDVTYEGDRRIWLITPVEDGQPLLQDISGTIARAAGRGANPDVSGLAIDLAATPAGGAISVGPALGANAAVNEVRVVDLAGIVSRTSAAR